MRALPLSKLALPAAIGAALAFGCGPATSPEPPLPTVVNVEFRQALIGPSKVGGAAWDGPGRLDSSAQGFLALALRAVNPYAAAVDVFANPAIAALERPEPRGRARCIVNGIRAQQVDLVAQNNTLTPIWKDARLVRMPLGPSTRIELDFYDKDLLSDEPMGAATITYAQLVAALRAGATYRVRVAEQTNNQVLFVDISVDAAH